MVTTNQIERGFARWLDAELMPHIPKDGWPKVIAGAAASIMIKRGGQMVKALMNHPIIVALDIAKNGEIDLEIIRDELKANMTEAGLIINLPLIGELKLHKNDIDVIYTYMTEA